MKLTEAQRRILNGLRNGGTYVVSAGEETERATLESAGLVESFEFDGVIGSGQSWWIAVWRITDAGRAALGSSRTGGRDA